MKRVQDPPAFFTRFRQLRTLCPQNLDDGIAFLHLFLQQHVDHRPVSGSQVTSLLPLMRSAGESPDVIKSLYPRPHFCSVIHTSDETGGGAGRTGGVPAGGGVTGAATGG